MPAFITPLPSLRGPSLLSSPRSPLRAPVRTPPRRASRRAPHHPRAQLAGNIEDMPAELLPASAADMPPHWARAGVYGVYSSAGTLQYVAAVTDVRDALAAHLRYVPSPEARHAVRMMTVDDAADAPLGQIAEAWVFAHAGAAGVPPGNSDAAPEWRLEAPPTDVLVSPGDQGEFLGGEIKRVIREFPVVAFIKGTRSEPRCGFSQAVVAAVGDVVAEGFVCVDVLDERNGGLREAVKDFSRWPTLPQLYVGGEFVGGSDIVLEMVREGTLEGTLKKALGVEA